MAYSKAKTSDIDELFYRVAKEVCDSDKMREMAHFRQHGETSCLEHSMAVAFYSLLLSEKLGIKCDRIALIRGGLLHDYYLYDWHVKENKKSHKLHGFSHPRTALENADRDYDLSERERNIILRHMFPLVPVPPKFRESVIVSLVDKWCAVVEATKKSPYKNRTILMIAFKM